MLGLCRIAKCYIIKGKFELAQTYYQRALEVDSKYKEALQGLATSYFAMVWLLRVILNSKGKFEEGEKYSSSAIAIEPTPQLFIQRAGAYIKMNKLDEALQDTTAALRLRVIVSYCNNQLA